MNLCLDEIRYREPITTRCGECGRIHIIYGFDMRIFRAYWESYARDWVPLYHHTCVKCGTNVEIHEDILWPRIRLRDIKESPTCEPC
jgi:ribosomal protein S14